MAKRLLEIGVSKKEKVTVNESQQGWHGGSFSSIGLKSAWHLETGEQRGIIWNRIRSNRERK